MATAWFITPYASDVNTKPMPSRWCRMNEFNTQIFGDGGIWEEIEAGANFAIVKVSASAATLSTIASSFLRIPVNQLNTTLASLSNAKKTALRNKIIEMGYTSQEITNALGSNIGTKTLRQLLNFIITRRIKPRFDSVNKQIVFDGEAVTPSKTVEEVDGRVQ